MARLGELLWIVDLNRQSLDRVVPDVQTDRLTGMFEAAGWQVITLKWGRAIAGLFALPGGDELRQRLEDMSNEEYQRMLRVDAEEIAALSWARVGARDYAHCSNPYRRQTLRTPFGIWVGTTSGCCSTPTARSISSVLR